MAIVFHKGSATGADVRKLIEAFGTPSEGAEISHDEIASAIENVSPSDSRYKTVVAAWRKVLLERHDVDLGSVHGYGYRVLNAQERIDAGINGSKSGMKKILRSARRGDRVVTADPVLMHKQQVQRRLVSVLTREFQDATKEFNLPQYQHQQPRIQPPSEAA